MSERLWAMLILIFLIAYVFLCISGCQILQPRPQPLPKTHTEVLINTAMKTNWLVTISIIGCALAAAAFLNGNKMALPLLIGCLTCLGMSLAVIRYATLIALGSLLAGGGVFIYSVFLKDRALKEIIKGGQIFKSFGREKTIAQDFNLVQQDAQSKATQKLVKKVKAEL